MTMDGIINLYKPTGITSAKALHRVRGITGQRKSGHAGTLDPSACGVLLICLGKATKLVERMMDLPKIYEAQARLDVTSESFDSEGPVEPVAVERVPTSQAVAQALDSFRGVISQVPPVLSAVKVGGLPAYKRARSGESVQLAPRPAYIYDVQLTRFDWPEVDFTMICGRGTYVRAVVRDLGEMLGTGGCLTGLERTAVGPFDESTAWTLDDLRSSTAQSYVMPLDKVVDLIESAVVKPGVTKQMERGHQPASDASV